MSILNILKKIFSKDKKIVIVGLDNSGKSTLVNFLQTGTFSEQTPTMGKDSSIIEVQGIRINLIDMGGQKDFRSLWLGELSDAECVIFMIDISDESRYAKAKEELWKLSKVIKSKPLIILANKYDLKPDCSLSDIITSLELMKLPSFEIIQTSCKTGYGIVDAFSKVYSKLTGKNLNKRITPKALTIFDQGGVPLTTKEGDYCNTEILRGGLFAAITNFIKESFNSELNQLKLDGNIIVVKKSKHFMGSLILDEDNSLDLNEAESSLSELLEHLENMCPEVIPEKVDYLVKQYATNIFS